MSCRLAAEGLTDDSPSGAQQSRWKWKAALYTWCGPSELQTAHFFTTTGETVPIMGNIVEGR